MKHGIFAEYAPQYWGKELSALPVVSGTKRPAVKQWPAFQANLPSETRRQEWLEEYGSAGIGINTGVQILPDEILVGIDVDDDRLVRLTAALLGHPSCGKRGKKGATYFVRMPKPKRNSSTILKGGEGLGNIDVLAGGKFTVLPPTIHPETDAPYDWLGRSLLEIEFTALPYVEKNTLDLLAAAIGSEHAVVITSGEATHDAGVRLTAELIAFGASDEEIETIFINLLPETYSGNSHNELSGWIESARSKGFDLFSGYGDYEAGDVGPLPLGYTRDGSYALRDQVRGIILVLSANQLLNYQSLVGLAPTGFWAGQFPSDKSVFSAVGAGEALIKACRDLGPFDPTHVRGRGIWKDGGKLIVNLGQELEPDLKHQYLAFSSIKVPDDGDVDAEALRALFRLFPFKDPNNADLLFGWVAIAPLCGALDWRPHGYLFGPPNSGKTTLHNLFASILKPMVIPADGQSTEAGIRQRLGPDALPMVIDEFETDSDQKRLQSIMRLARSASSAESPLLRGTPEGKAVQFSIKTMMLFSSVNVVGMSPADQSRFIMAELQEHDSDPETAARVTSECLRFEAMGPQWCGYVIGLAPTIIEGIDILKVEMASMDTRLRQTMASLLSGMFATLNRRPPTVEEAKTLVARYADTIKGHQREQDRDNARECLEHLMSHLVRSQGGVEYPLGFWLAVELGRQRRGEGSNYMVESERVLQQLQIKFCLGGEREGFLIRNGAAPINNVFRGTKWSNDAWARALGQLPGAFKLSAPQRFAALPGKHRSVGLPLDYVPDEDDLRGEVTF